MLDLYCIRNHGEESGKTDVPEAEVGSADQIILGSDGIAMQKVVEIFMDELNGDRS